MKDIMSSVTSIFCCSKTNTQADSSIELDKKPKDQKVVTQQIQPQNDEVLKQLEEKDNRIHRLEQENKSLQSQQNGKLKQELNLKEQQLQQLHNEKVDLKNRYAKYNEVFQNKESENKILNTQLQEKILQIQKIQKQYEELQTRFSKIASEQVTSGNTEIEDLSDTNRPMKLAEQFRHGIYGGEWCNAFEEFDHISMEEKEIIRYLFELCKLHAYVQFLCRSNENWKRKLQIFHLCYEFCKKRAAKELDDFNELLTNRFGLASQMEQRRKSSYISLLQAFIQDRKNIDNNTVDTLMMSFLMQLKEGDGSSGIDTSDRKINLIKPYIRGCIRCCCLMRVQDPPMALDFNVMKGEAVDKVRFEIYQTSGTEVDFIVWPAVLREENGGLLQKGIVEGTKESVTRPTARSSWHGSRLAGELVPPNSAEVMVPARSSTQPQGTQPQSTHSQPKHVTHIDTGRKTQ